MRSDLRRSGKNVVLRKEHCKALNIPTQILTGDVICYVNGCCVLLTSGYANYNLIYKSLKSLLEEIKILKDVERLREKELDKEEEVVEWK